MTSKAIVITDRIFHKLWDIALSSDSFNLYYSSVTNEDSPNFVNLSKFNLSPDCLYDLLKSIYNAANISINDILAKYNFSKASFAHRFCIPIRTVENWCSNTNKCPGYTKLMFLHSLNEQILPTGFQTEFINNSTQTKPTKKKSPSKKISKRELPKSLNYNSYNYNSNENFSLRDWEQTHSTDNSSDILSKTDYLSDILKRRPRQTGADS